MELDYKALGFKAGLEVHHQLDTERKLFCHCPVRLTNKPHDVELLRHMRPTLSELGEYDGTALMEFKTKKNVVYRLYKDLNCTYEMDDTPPFLVNEQALDISIAIAETFGMSLVDEVHITRKQYLDGSIPTGFQRTAIIGVGGDFQACDRTIGILHMSIEEDSCREVSDKGHNIVFKGDRLGFPLVEVVTAPDFMNPDEAAVGAEAVRRALWNLQMVRRGPGSARHDVNCSITGGTRIEIKGVPRISDIPHLLKNEAMRQKALLEIKDTLRLRGVNTETLERRTADVTRLMSHVDHPVLKKHPESRVVAVRLKGFGGLLDKQTQEHSVFADEFSGRVRVIACLDDMPNLLYPESKDATEINNGIWRKIRKRLNATHHDGILVVYGPDEDLETAVNEIFIRAREATKGVPPETRQALKNGSNDFERILPGADRMYPDTDHPPLPLTEDRIEKIRSLVPEKPWVREKRYTAMKLPVDIVKNLAISKRAPLFDDLVADHPDKALWLGELLWSKMRGLQRHGFAVNTVSTESITQLVEKWVDGQLYREGFDMVLRHLSVNPQSSAEEALSSCGITPVAESEISDVIKTVSKLKPEKEFPCSEARLNWLMGQVMKQLRGRIAGSQLVEMVRKSFSISV